ncbi:MAG: Xanthine dehydrogenase, molybdenum binding subunit [Ramlibacter sp.]|jgi:CO/xanthine dehydrogenase Mo-binding subunit|uniref:xanthine dehydrogenase family protein molybdopterin-binding subunit n=1 Tax=Ramlibacter sp. TaxID=1917967 RepID=UPI002625D240|nr:xanthine dehydrogenase family protein molybdopterin-binding subunit [Ramlibacter sp.]MDB5753072.1 Xanthine dehydrogenase, molybdenum binding subunit [Ramlibacter sp.]
MTRVAPVAHDPDATRVDAPEKTTGTACYAADVVLPGMLHAKVLRSARAHARLLGIDVTLARQVPGVRAVVTGQEVRQAQVAPHGYFIKDRPALALDKVRFEGEIIAAVAADSEAAAVRALELIVVEYEDLAVVASIDAALDAAAPALFESPPQGHVPAYGAGASGRMQPAKNVCFEFDYTTGDAAAFSRCDHVFEDEFRFSRMQHFTLEPFVCVADAANGRFQVWSSTHTPFVLRRELARIFGMPENAVTVHVGLVGGSFGSKSSCRNEPVALLLSRLSGRPVRLCMTLEEGFRTSSQHGAVLRLKTGVMRDGRLVARSSEIYLDSGAYSDASPLVAEKAGYRIPGPYRWDFIETRCMCVMTNTTPAGAFRGFGASQATWASESQVDMIARRLGIDPFQMRARNLLQLGQPFVPGESGVDSDLLQGLQLVADEIGYGQPRLPGHGIGLAIGFKDGGGVNKPAQARVKVSANGDVFLHCATVEIGQGARTALSQVVATVLATPLRRVYCPPVDTDYAPFDQGTNASSGIAVMGQAVAQAASRLKDQVLAFAAEQLACAAHELLLDDWTVRRGDEVFPLAPLIVRQFGGTGFEFTADGFSKAARDHGAPLEAKSVFWEIGWAAAEVAVDRETGLVKVTRLVVSGDAGRVINTLACKGQDQGAAVMGLGQALFEGLAFDADGVLVNTDPLDYRVPLAEDLPASFLAITQEQGHGPGPFGSKGMGEGGMLPVASAIANAIEDAAGVRITALPLTPLRVLEALVAAGSKTQQPVDKDNWLVDNQADTTTTRERA